MKAGRKCPYILFLGFFYPQSKQRLLDNNRERWGNFIKNWWDYSHLVFEVCENLVCIEADFALTNKDKQTSLKGRVVVDRICFLFWFFYIYLNWFSDQRLPECMHFSLCISKGRQRARFSSPHTSFSASHTLPLASISTSRHLPKEYSSMLDLADILGSFEMHWSLIQVKIKMIS